VPQLLSRCLHPLPHELEDQETKIRNRHVDLLLHPRGQDIIRLRSHIIKYLRQFLENDEYVEVQTPIIADTAGGAVARPFQTDATEFQHRELALRIAPELWLKRLILGGFDKVFEIGPSFRNEGIDLNHNPEFTTCEFYKTYADLEELIKMTEAIFLGLSRVVAAFIETDCRSLSRANIGLSPPYKRLDFIPAIEAAVGSRLPNLILPDSQSQLLDLFNQHDIPLPTNPTIPLLLDKLSATYLEPQCVAPTWIIYPPECLSPLSKSFLHPDNTQRVAARAELFIDKQEFVNTYEEENAPMEQRRKFEDQLRFQEGGPEASLDESYLQALEWGLPPTGGWGCGIDRLCMLFAGTKRIADVLAFGNLRNVVALRQNTKKPQDDSNEYDVPLSSLLGENQ
jgi:lysyl-tRNA synthetase class 2